MSTKLPRDILEKAIQLRDSLKTVFIALYSTGKPCTATEVAQLAGKTRAYTCMRLNQLVDMKLVQVTRPGKTKLYEVIKDA
jgi:DNA-binding transcriptional regulator GbsR (MarR family)